MVGTLRLVLVAVDFQQGMTAEVAGRHISRIFRETYHAVLGVLSVLRHDEGKGESSKTVNGIANGKIVHVELNIPLKGNGKALLTTHTVLSRLDTHVFSVFGHNIQHDHVLRVGPIPHARPIGAGLLCNMYGCNRSNHGTVKKILGKAKEQEGQEYGATITIT